MDHVLQREEKRVRNVAHVRGVGLARAEDSAERLGRSGGYSGGGGCTEKRRIRRRVAVHESPVRASRR